MRRLRWLGGIALTCLSGVACVQPGLADSLAPASRPVEIAATAPYRRPDGAVFVAGSASMRGVLERLNALFGESHPGVHFDMLLGNANLGVNALTANIAAFAPIDRVAWELERRPFRVTFGHEPTGIRIGRHGLVGEGHINPPGVYVNAKNPIAGLSLAQVTRIFTTGAGQGDLTYWNQAGASGAFGERRIHPFGPRDDGGFATNTRLNLMGSYQFAPGYEPFSQPAEALRAVAQDPYGIALADFFDARAMPDVKLLPLSVKDGALFVLPTAEDMGAGRYPFAPFLYLYVNRTPGQPLDPLAKDYVRLALSREGQAIIASQKDAGFVPLDPGEVAAELAKLD